MSLLSQINLERLDTNTIVKYFIDPENDSNSGFYLYAWSSISKQFIKTTQRADDPDYVKADLIYILDHHLPQAGENPASHHTVLLNSQTGDDHFVIEASLATSVVIDDSGGTGNLVQFASGFEAQTIILTPGPAVDLLIDFIDGNGNAQTLIIKDAARFQFQFGEDGARLSLDAFYTTVQTNGFIAQPLPDLPDPNLPAIGLTESQEEGGANTGLLTLSITRPISLDTDDLPETLTLSTRHIKARFGNDVDAETITYSVKITYFDFNPIDPTALPRLGTITLDALVGYDDYRITAPGEVEVVNVLLGDYAPNNLDDVPLTKYSIDSAILRYRLGSQNTEADLESAADFYITDDVLDTDGSVIHGGEMFFTGDRVLNNSVLFDLPGNFTIIFTITMSEEGKADITRNYQVTVRVPDSGEIVQRPDDLNELWIAHDADGTGSPVRMGNLDKDYSDFDSLIGLGGDDVIIINNGDYAAGGEGNDTFIVQTADFGQGNIIADYTTGDTIIFKGSFAKDITYEWFEDGSLEFRYLNPDVFPAPGTPSGPPSPFALNTLVLTGDVSGQEITVLLADSPISDETRPLVIEKPVFGTDGNDTITPTANTAQVFAKGGDGDDFLDGGHGDNNYWGGAGDDIFFLGVHDRQPNRPTDKFGEVYIHDFVQGEDKFQLADYYTAVGLGEWQGDTNIYLWHRDFGSANNLDEFSFLNMFADTFSGEIIRFTGTLTEDDFVDLGDVNLVIF